MIEAQLEKLAASPSSAKGLIEDPTTAAVALLPAVKVLVGGDYTAWEPETLWLELEHHHIDVPAENRDKLQAIVALYLVPAFYWDAVVFEKTCLAFDGVTVNGDTLQEADPAQLSWGVREAAWLCSQHGDAPRDFAHEPGAYASVVCQRAGLVLAPTQLSFCQELLDDAQPQAAALKKEVATAWAALDKTTLAKHSFKETPLDVQLAHLAAIELHIRDRESRASSDLTRLSSR